MAVALPAGAREVELSFDSAPFRTGSRVTLALIAFSLLLMFAGWKFDHRPPQVPDV